MLDELAEFVKDLYSILPGEAPLVRLFMVDDKCLLHVGYVYREYTSMNLNHWDRVYNLAGWLHAPQLLAKIRIDVLDSIEARKREFH